MVRALSHSARLREFCGFSECRTPSHETLRRFACDAAAEPVLARWTSAVRAHGPGLRSRTPIVSELERAWAALDPRELLAELDRHGKPGRTGYRAEPMVRAVMLGAYTGEGCWADVTRELQDNPPKASWCGFAPGEIPSCSTLRRWAVKVSRSLDLLAPASRRMLDDLAEDLCGFSDGITVDRTFLRAYCNGRKPEPRSDPDARFGFATKNRGKGTQEVDIGYGLHVAASSTTGIPVNGLTTAANVRETNLLPTLLKQALVLLPGPGPLTVSADAGYDSLENAEFVTSLYASPVIGIRRMNGAEFVYGPGGDRMRYDGTPVCPACDTLMEFLGHSGEAERDRRCQVWRCGDECGARLLDIQWRKDPRRTPYHPRQSEEYQSARRQHQAIERCFFLLKGTGNFLSDHRVRGREKVDLRLQFGILTMQARALAACRDGRPKDIRRVKRPVT